MEEFDNLGRNFIILTNQKEPEIKKFTKYKLNSWNVSNDSRKCTIKSKEWINYVG